MLSTLLNSALGMFIDAGVFFSRAGGGGGGHGGGGGGHGGGGFGGSGYGGTGGGLYVHSYGNSNDYGGGLSFGTWVLIVIVLVTLAIYLNRKNRSAGRSDGSDDLRVFHSVTTALAQEQLTQLSQKVQTAFLIVEECWSEKNLSKMRRFISDGVYQRFNAQFTMMNIFGQSNPMSNVEVRGMKIVNYSIEGAYEHVDLAIRAYAEDQFICEKYPFLNSPGGAEEFQEVWSFIRRRDHMKSADIFHNHNCPKCGGNLDHKLLETARCSFCGVYLNSGEFDWVLNEIIQEQDYGDDTALAGYQSTDLKPIIQEVEKVYPAFSTHVLEDRASNAFMQILIGLATHKIDVLKRFTTPAAFEKIKLMLVPEQLVYNRLYIADARLIAIEGHENTLRAHVGIEYFSQIVQITPTSARPLDTEVLGTIRVVTFVHELSGSNAKGNVFANSCPACGAAQKGGLAVSCEYCGAVLNDPKLDWVAENIQTIEEFSKAELTT